MTEMQNQHRIVLITGAASGLGEAIARRLATQNWCCVIADIDMDNADSVARDLGAPALSLLLDVTDEAQWKAAISEIDSRFGRLDALINNAGISTLGTIEDLDLETFQNTFRVDVDSVFLGCKYGIGLIKKTGGAIVNMSSAAGNRASSGLTAYSAAKGAVNNLTRSVALHCAEQGYSIRCNSVHPGAIHTPIIDKVLAQADDPDAVMQSFVAAHPVGHIGDPGDIAAIVSYLVSDESRFATGGQFVVDGGMTL